jgi:DNA repair protein RadC
MALYYCIPRKDTNPLAHRLVNRFGSFAGVLSAKYEVLLEVDGVGIEIATYLKFLVDCCKLFVAELQSKMNRISSIHDVVKYVQNHYVFEAARSVMLVCLSQSGMIVYVRRIAHDKLIQADTFPLNIVKICVKANAAKVIIAYAHADDLCKTTNTDIAIMKRLCKALRYLDIELYDYLMLSQDDVFSMRENEMMPD